MTLCRSLKLFLVGYVLNTLVSCKLLKRSRAVLKEIGNKEWDNSKPYHMEKFGHYYL